MALFGDVKHKALKRDAARATSVIGLLRDYQWPTFLVALAGLVLTTLAWSRTAAWEDRVARAEFETQANSHLDFLQEGFADYRAAFQDYHGDLKVTAGVIGRKQLDINAADLIQKNKGISSLAWVPRVSRAERLDFEAAARRDGLDGYRILELAAPGRRAGSDAAEFYPILYATTSAPGRARVGLDLGSNPATRALLEQARDRGELSVSGTLPFLIDAGGPEFIAAQPVYRGIGVPSSVSERRQNLIGFTLGTFRLSQMIDGPLARFTTPYGLHTYIYRDNASANDLPIYVRASHLIHVSAPLRTFKAAEGKLHASRLLTLGNRSWLAVLVPGQNRLLGLWRLPALAILALGLLLCALATSYARSIGRRRQRDSLSALEIRALADRYSTVFNSVNDGIFLSDLATGRFVEVNQAGRDMFGYTSGELVGATIDAVSSGLGPYTRDRAAKILLKLLAGIPQKFVWQAKRKDGDLFWVDVSQHHIFRNGQTGARRSPRCYRGQTHRGGAVRFRNANSEQCWTPMSTASRWWTWKRNNFHMETARYAICSVIVPTNSLRSAWRMCMRPRRCPECGSISKGCADARYGLRPTFRSNGRMARSSSPTSAPRR